MDGQGLIIGIDLGKTKAYVSYFEEKDVSATSVSAPDGNPFFGYPVTPDRWPVIVREGYAGQLEDICAFLNQCIEQVKRLTKRNKIGMLVFTPEDYTEEFLDSLSVILARMGIDKASWRAISHEEAYIYYAYNQKRELYLNGVMILDYQETGIRSYLSGMRDVNSRTAIMQNSYLLSSDTINKAVNADSLDKVTDEIIQWLSDIFKDFRVSSVYLTGPGFDRQEFPKELIKYLCARRKVFAGQNIYVRGAAFSGYEELYPMAADKKLILCNNRIIVGIELDIAERGKPKRLRVVSPGVNWYFAGKEYQFIADDLRELNIYIKHVKGDEERVVRLDLTDIPYRPGKLTRLKVEFKFIGHKRCSVTVTDKGFGDFAKSSGKVIYEQFDIV